ncbi:10380_t:CDS:2, partial [Cetraspora pellucida]
GINDIIKSTLTSKTSLCELVSVLNSRLLQKSLFIHYNNWSEIYSKPTSLTTSTKLLPKVDVWIAKFLMPPVLSLQRAKIAKALWYSSTLISRESMNVNFIYKQDECNAFDDLDDFPVMNIDEILNLFMLSIKECWKVIHYHSSNKNFVIVFEDSSHIYGSTILVSKPILNLNPTYSDYYITFDNMLKTLDFYYEYGITNGLCKKAIIIKLEAGSVVINTLNKFLKNFTRQHSANNKQQTLIMFKIIICVMMS